MTDNVVTGEPSAPVGRFTRWTFPVPKTKMDDQGVGRRLRVGNDRNNLKNVSLKIINKIQKLKCKKKNKKTRLTFLSFVFFCPFCLLCFLPSSSKVNFLPLPMPPQESWRKEFNLIFLLTGRGRHATNNPTSNNGVLQLIAFKIMKIPVFKCWPGYIPVFCTTWSRTFLQFSLVPSSVEVYLRWPRKFTITLMTLRCGMVWSIKLFFSVIITVISLYSLKFFSFFASLFSCRCSGGSERC